jgi:hypothetical protein
MTEPPALMVPAGSRDPRGHPEAESPIELSVVMFPLETGSDRCCTGRQPGGQPLPGTSFLGLESRANEITQRTSDCPRQGIRRPFLSGVSIPLSSGTPSGLMTRVLRSRFCPIVLGLLSAFTISCVWGSLDSIPVFHDEAAYFLQAQIFAQGRWSAPAPPISEFFEQYHVLVTPVLAGKYPPGHSMLLTPGIWVGLPGLVPVILVGVAGGLLFALARRFGNPWVALLTWLIWTTSPGNLRFLPSYLSQDTTVALWLVGWWALAQWRDGRSVFWLAALSACVAWGVLTRPFTMVGYAVAAGFVVVREIVRRRAWRDFAVATVLIALILALIPAWSLRTTGSLTTPYSLYSRTYFPYQRPGFGLPLETRAKRELPPDMARYGEEYRAMHAAHTLLSVPRAVIARLWQIASDTWGNTRWPLALLALLGLFVVPQEGLFALGTCGLLLLSHLPFAHPSDWSVYYLELQAPLAFVGALGFWAVVVLIAVRPRPSWQRLAHTSTAAGAFAVASVVLGLARPLVVDVKLARVAHLARSAQQEHFRQLVASIPAPHAVVFVRYGPSHNFHFSLIANDPGLANAKAWIVYDRGSDNARLMAIAPDRVPYLYDEASRKLVRLGSATQAKSRLGNL